MAGSQRFSPSYILFQLVYDRGQCAESSYLKSKVGSTLGQEGHAILLMQLIYAMWQLKLGGVIDCTV